MNKKGNVFGITIALGHTVFKCKRERAVKAGKVYLVGAGPGDPELITLKAVRCLQQADFVLVDDLVNRSVLEHVGPGVRVVEVGKRGGCKSTPQKFITRQLIRLARQGWTVVRLKGGDPFMFGRGGEEMLALREAGVVYEVVNGVTSGLAAASSVGVPLTHRDFAQGVAFVTGHTRDGGAVEWQGLVQSGLTLVIYMGMKNLAAIVGSLRQAGMAAAMPVAVIQHGTLAQQRHLLADLGSVVEQVEKAGLGSPSIIVVGQVAALARTEELHSLARQAA